MAEIDDLMEKAQQQLDEHQVWLETEIDKLPADVSMAGGKTLLIVQARNIRLRAAKAGNGLATVVYEYPDELYAFLRSDVAPKHLRDTLVGGHVVDPNQPASSVKRVVE